jgi:signal transduction histidine kinase
LATYHAKEKRQFTEALKQIDQAERIAEETGHKQVLKEVYHIRSFVEEERGDFASALVYFKKYKILETDLFNEKTVNQLQEYEVRYQTAQKDLELERRQAEINQHKTRQTIFIGGLSIAVLVLLLLTVIIRNGKHRNRELAKNNAFKDKLFSIISHDLRNPATAQRNSLKLLIDNENKWDMPIICEAHKKLFKSADGLVELLQNLLNWAQLQTGRQSFHPLSFDLVKALQPDINVIQDVIERKNITFETEMPQYALVTGDKNMLATVVRNLLVNAVKFTSTGGEVSLRIDKDGEKYTVSVSDTGIGMSAEQIQHLFHIDRKQSHIGTAGEIGSGLGLIVCKELLEKHGSTLHIESEMEVGSRFWFEV